MRRIPLSKGKYALVDNKDFDWINQYKWAITNNKNSHTFYAIRMCHKKEKYFSKSIRMHRYIIKAVPGEIVDHINGNGLDNRRKNLRIVSNANNVVNQRLHKNNTSGHRGVSWSKRDKKWYAYIMVNYKTIALGKFTKKNDAIVAFKKAAKKHFGIFI